MTVFLTGRFTRGDDTDGFFMADHMYYKEKSFAFGITDGGLAGFGRVTGVHYRDEEVKEHLAGDVKRHAVFLNIGVCKASTAGGIGFGISRSRERRSLD